MHCKACEIATERSLSAVKGVRKVSVSASRGAAEIWWEEQKPAPADVVRAVEEAGYSVGEEESRHFIAREGKVWFEAFLAAAVVFILYMLARVLGFSGFDAGVVEYPGIATVFLIGITAGVSTCMAVVGGLVMGIAARHAAAHPDVKGLSAFRPHIIFNLGRLAGYAVFGGVIGAAGSVLQISARSTGVFILAAGAVMLYLGIQILEIFPRLSAFSLPKAIAKRLGLSNQGAGAYSKARTAISGALTFFLPCGFTQAMQIYAISTGSFAIGALTMFVFALGTMPGLLGVGGLMSFSKGEWGRLLTRVIAVIVIAFGIVNIAAGLSASGVAVPWSRLAGSADSLAGSFVPVEEGVQTARMSQRGDGYYPNFFTVKAGSPVRWIITSESQYSCATTVSVPALNIRKRLSPGENIVEFTPEKPGRLVFSCGMGMYTGEFKVVL